MTDLQTITNAGFFEEDLCVRYGLQVMDERAKILFGDDEDAITDYFASLVNVSDAARRDMDMPKPEWALVRAMKLQHESKTLPCSTGDLQAWLPGFSGHYPRPIPLKGAIRVYARPNPLVMMPNGMPDFTLDTLGGERDGCLRCAFRISRKALCLLGAIQTPTQLRWSLSANILVPELLESKGQGWCFFGANAGDLLGKLNGGDMDDNLFAIQDPAFIAKWQTMDYPVQPS